MGIEGIEEMIDDPSLSDEEVIKEQKKNEQLVIEGIDIFRCNPDESLGIDKDDNEGSAENR